jgi:hypothetical protein
MSSAGHVMDMIARMRANALRRRNPFDRKVELKDGGLDPELFRPLTEVQLAEIRSKATAQRRHERRVTYVVIGILLVLVLGLYISI